jgi:hypothetical protein
MMTIYWSEVLTEQLPEGGDRESTVMSQVYLDIIESDMYSVAAQVTSHAVEEGINISDHVRPAQDRATASVIVSNRHTTTFFVAGSHGAITLNDGSEVTGIIAPDGTDRSGDVHSTLRRLCREGIEVDVDGLQRPVEAWLIESVSAPRSVETAGALVCDIAFVEIRYAEVSEVSGTYAPSPRVERGRRRRDRGTAGEESTDEGTPISSTNVSALEGGLRAAGRLLAGGS